MWVASHVPKFPGDYESARSTALIFHLFLFAEHDQLTILTQEVSLQNSPNSVRHLVWISCTRTPPNHTVSSFFSGSLYFVLTLPRRAFHSLVTPLHGALRSVGERYTVKRSRAFPSWAARTQLCNQTFLLAGGLCSRKLITERETAGIQTRKLKTHMCPLQGGNRVGNSKQKSPLLTNYFNLESKILGFLDMPWPNGIVLNLFSHDSSSGNKGNGN